MFGLKLSTLAAEDFQSRLAKVGLLKPIKESKYVTRYVCANPDIEEDISVEKNISDIINELKAYTINRLREFHYLANDQDVETAIFECLVTMEFQHYVTHPGDLPDAVAYRENNQKNDKEIPSIDRAINYLVARYIYDVYRENPQKFDVLCDICAGDSVGRSCISNKKPTNFQNYGARLGCVF